MRLLLLTDIPPCWNYTAGIVLAQLAGFLEQDSLICFCVKHPDIQPVIPDDLSWMPIQYAAKPRENWRFLPKQLGAISSFIAQSLTEIYPTLSLRDEIIKFGRHYKVDAVWCVLQGQTMIRLAVPVANRLGVPLLTEVWDPLRWWLQDNRVDSLSSKRILHQFSLALQSSNCCATASWNMADEYYQRYGCQTISFLPSLPASWAKAPAKTPCNESDFTIGLAGQIYATDTWNALIKALDKTNWKLADRNVCIRLLGSYFNLNATSSTNIEFLGWRSQLESLDILSQTDLLYCPYWFSNQFIEEARLSFPSKLTTYLATGRPVFMHAPEYASPTVFLKNNNAAFCCMSTDPDQIVSLLYEAATNKNSYQEVALNGHNTFLKYLTLDILRDSFQKFIMTVKT